MLRHCSTPVGGRTSDRGGPMPYGLATRADLVGLAAQARLSWQRRFARAPATLRDRLPARRAPPNQSRARTSPMTASGVIPKWR